MEEIIQILDVVALLEDIPECQLKRGQVGTVVEELAPHVFEVEFNDEQGRTYAMIALYANQLIVLHYQPTTVV
jgi:hypothetical protein